MSGSDPLAPQASIETLERLWRDEGARLWRAVAAFAGDAEVANDAVSESFAQALAHQDRIRDPLAWIWRTAFRLAMREVRQRRRRPPPGPLAYEMGPILVDVLEALKHLSPKQRAVILMCDYADRSSREVAKTLGITQATVRSHLSQGRRRLRELLREESDD